MSSNEMVEFQGRTNGPTAMVEVAASKAAQEVQAAMVLAKRFPRDEVQAYSRIMQACKRPTLAEVAVYEYPRGGQKVTGPSIRLAEALAQNWGNIQAGIVEVEQRPGESTMMAYSWDLETNTRVERTFQVKHERGTRNGNVKLTDPRDIYEMTANQGARRLRACILSVIPGDVVEAAVKECDRTMETSGGDEPLIDRARKMVAAFQTYGVTQTMIEKRLGHKLDAISQSEIVGLKKVFASIRDGMAGREAYFDMAPIPGTDVLGEVVSGKAKAKGKEGPPQGTMLPPDELPGEPD